VPMMPVPRTATARVPDDGPDGEPDAPDAAPGAEDTDVPGTEPGPGADDDSVEAIRAA
jgi:hypothetical protein